MNKKKNNEAFTAFLNELSYFHNMFKEGFKELGENPREYTKLGFYGRNMDEAALSVTTPSEGVPEISLALAASGITVVVAYGKGEKVPVQFAFSPADTKKKNFVADKVEELVISGHNPVEVFGTLKALLYTAVNNMTEARRINNSRKYKGVNATTSVRQWCDTASSYRYELEGVLSAVRNDTLHEGVFRKTLAKHGAFWLGSFRTVQLTASTADRGVDYYLNAFSNGDISLSIRSRETRGGLKQLFITALPIIREAGEAERIADALCNCEVPFSTLMEKMLVLLPALLDNARAVADSLARSRRATKQVAKA